MTGFLRGLEAPPEVLEGLNERQREAVSQLDGPLMIVAGPGSGKTRVLTHRVGALLLANVRPYNILAVTFTNKAAGEMRERLVELVGEEKTSRVTACTFHSFCVRLLRRYHAEAGIDEGFTIADAEDSRKIVRMVMVGLGLVGDESKRYAGAISWAKNNMQSPSEVESDLYKLKAVYEGYQRELTRQNLVDFDDLLGMALRLLKNNAVVLEDVRDHYRYVMVDEYQDTNRVQYEIVRLIASEHHNICVVGDHDQSIYAWRGAFSEAITGFAEDFPGTTVIALDQNYRSTKNVVDASRRIIEANPAAYRGELWTGNESGAPVRIVSCEDERHEAEWIVNELSKYPGSSAVIVRTKAQTKSFEVALASRGIAHVVVGTQRFYDRAEIKDALAWLRLALNPLDESALGRVVVAPRRGLGDVTLSQLTEIARREQIGPLAVIEDVELLGEFSTRAAKTLVGLASDVRKVRAGAGVGPDEALKCVLELGLAAQLGGEPERLENLSQLVSDATVFTSSRDTNGLDLTSEFVESASLSSAADAGAILGSGRVPVSVITAHASKGREFDNVFVAGVEEGLYPHRLVVEEDRGIEEERRLLFVAVSRAKERLTITWCKRRMIFGKWDNSGPSVFLRTLNGGAIELDAGGARMYGPSGLNTRNTGAFTRPRVRPPVEPSGKTLVGVAYTQLTRGAKVSHPSFGVGEVLEDASAKEVRVRFGDKIRTLMVELAPLTIL